MVQPGVAAPEAEANKLAGGGVHLEVLWPSPPSARKQSTDSKDSLGPHQTKPPSLQKGVLELKIPACTNVWLGADCLAVIQTTAHHVQ